MEVTFDPAKSATNLAKHGIALDRAQDFDFLASLLQVDDSQDYGEIRFVALGWLDAALYTLVFIVEDEMVRPISLRKSTKQEKKKYAENF